MTISIEQNIINKSRVVINRNINTNYENILNKEKHDEAKKQHDKKVACNLIKISRRFNKKSIHKGIIIPLIEIDGCNIRSILTISYYIPTGIISINGTGVRVNRNTVIHPTTNNKLTCDNIAGKTNLYKTRRRHRERRITKKLSINIMEHLFSRQHIHFDKITGSIFLTHSLRYKDFEIFQSKKSSYKDFL